MARWSATVARGVGIGVRRLMDLGGAASDSSTERTAKAALTLAALMLGSLAGVWTLLYFRLGLTAVALIPLTYQVGLLLALAYFTLTKDFIAFRRVSLSLLMVTPIALQFALGGFHPSSGVALWSFAAPLGAVVACGARQSLKWFLTYLVLISLSLVAHGPEVQVPTATVIALFVANVCGVSTVIYLFIRYFVRQREQALILIQHQQTLLTLEQRKSEELLLNILPGPVAERLKQHQATIADRLPDVSVLFADLVDFTDLSIRETPEMVVGILNRLFTAFDELADHWNVEKIKTIGDAYMAAGGVIATREDHLAAVAHLALAMQGEADRQGAAAGLPLQLRIGIAVGPVVAGVIGRRKFAFDMWGDTVNTASRMQSTGSPGAIQVSSAAYERLCGQFHFQQRTEVMVKGKGEMSIYILCQERSKHAAKAGTDTWTR